jgi:hypothetical protein
MADTRTITIRKLGNVQPATDERPAQDGIWYSNTPINGPRLVARFRPQHIGHSIGDRVRGAENPNTWDCDCGERVSVEVGEIDMAMQAAMDAGPMEVATFEAAIGPPPKYTSEGVHALMLMDGYERLSEPAPLITAWEGGDGYAVALDAKGRAFRRRLGLRGSSWEEAARQADFYVRRG